MPKVGRPKIEIDQTTFEKLCGLFCTEQDIADWYDCSIDTVNNWCKETYGRNFSEVYKKFIGRGKVSLRRNQLKLSEKSAAMAIFLGKQYLGQSDRVEVQSNVPSAIEQVAKQIFGTD